MTTPAIIQAVDALLRADGADTFTVTAIRDLLMNGPKSKINRLTYKEAAAELRISVRQIRRRIKTGKLTATKEGHRTAFITADQIRKT